MSSAEHHNPANSARAGFNDVRQVFPWLALIAVLLATIALAAAAFHFQLIPYTERIEFETNTGRRRVVRAYSGLFQQTHEPADYNLLAKKYLEYVGPFPMEENWIVLSEYCGEYSGDRFHEQSFRAAFWEIDLEATELAVHIEQTSNPGYRIHTPFGYSDEAKGLVIVRFLDVFARTLDVEVARAYRNANTLKAWELKRQMGADDIVDVDWFMQQPMEDFHLDPRIHKREP